jgi:hypothetical protein
MTIGKSAGTIAAWLALALPALAQPAYSVKAVPDTAPPRELNESIRKLLDNRCIQLLDAKGSPIVEIWLRKEVPAKATDAQVKNGLTYREVPSSTVLGAARVVKPTTDYKKQKIPSGVYTLRLGIQPEDGDHMGTAPYNEFCLLCPAAADKKPDLLEVKPLRELSAKVTDTHPGVLVLFPGDKEAGAEPKLVGKDGGHWVLFTRLSVVVNGKKATMALGINLVGASASA